MKNRSIYVSLASRFRVRETLPMEAANGSTARSNQRLTSARSSSKWAVQMWGLLCLLWSLSVCGCQSMTHSVPNPFTQIPTATASDPIVEIVGLWEATDGVGLDDRPTRGFAGKLMFFTKRQQEPVRINGDITIYVFDNLGTVEEQSKPIHQFKFEQEAFQAFLTQTGLGHAYQLFIPYTRKTTEKAKCTIRVKVTPENSRPVYSKMAAVTLPGTEPTIKEEQPTIKQRDFGTAIQRAQHETQESRQETSPTPEAAAAYFGKASLPQASNSSAQARQRLHSALSRVVKETNAATQNRRSQHETIQKSVRTNSKDSNTPLQRHPLLSE